MGHTSLFKKEYTMDINASFDELKAAVNLELANQYNIGYANGKISGGGSVPSPEPVPSADPTPAPVGFSQEEMDMAVKSALDGFKAELKAKYEEAQVVESTTETGFGALLG
jgi:hypothetical protein